MACGFIEGKLKLKMPDVSQPYIPPYEAEIRRKKKAAFAKTVINQQALFAECYRLKTAVQRGFEIVKESSLEWEDIETTPLKKNDENVWNSRTSKREVLEPFKMYQVEWMDPAIEEWLRECVWTIQKHAIPKLQQCINAVRNVYDKDLSEKELGVRNKLLEKAIPLRNELQELRNEVYRLGIFPSSHPRLCKKSTSTSTKPTETLKNDTRNYETGNVT